MMSTIMLQAGEGGWSDPGEYRLVEQQAEGGSDSPPGRHHHVHHHHHHHVHHFHQYYDHFNRVAKTCQLVGANFSRLVLIFGQSTRKKPVPLHLMLISLLPWHTELCKMYH